MSLSIALTAAIFFAVCWLIAYGINCWFSLPGYVRSLMAWLAVCGVVIGVCWWVGFFLVVLFS